MEKLTILIVDDTKKNKDMLKTSFGDDYNIIEAKNAGDALALLKTNEVGLIIIDIFTSPIKGYDLIKNIRRIAKYELTPIIAVIEGDEASRYNALSAGADNYICRPVAHEALQQCVKLAMYNQSLKNKIESLEKLLQIVQVEDRKKIEKLQKKIEEMQNENHAKTNFLSRVSHDMRTPLNGILGLTALMKDKIHDTDLLKDLSQLEVSGNFLLNLINDTLDISRIESGNFELHPTVCEGKETFNNVVSLAKVNMRNKNIHFCIHESNLPFTILYIDSGRIMQAIMNVLGNAAKFTPEGGQVDLTIRNVSTTENTIIDEIIVQDNGIGMSSEFLPHLFEPFSQANSSKTEVRQGTGLGMTLTKQALELMGGSISVESELGKGTKVKMTVPLKIASPEQIAKWEKEKAIERNNTSLNGKRILLCEDHPLNTLIARKILEKRGMLVEHAENGLVGLQMFEKSPLDYYNAVLMDIRMPKMDGIEATQRIRRLPRADAASIPIIALTANAFDSDVQESKESGMDEHFGKPIQPELLYDTLEKLLSLDRDIRKTIILIVDDVEVNRAVLHTALEDEFDIIEAENGREALDILNTKNGIDVVITDIQMPIMDGMELIKKIRENKRFQHIAIIANTQHGNFEQEEKMLSLGANDFIYNPITPKIVKIRVKTALRKF